MFYFIEILLEQDEIFSKYITGRNLPKKQHSIIYLIAKYIDKHSLICFSCLRNYSINLRGIINSLIF